MLIVRTCLFVFTVLFASAFTALHAENIVFPDDSYIRNVQTMYGAKGDGVTDDTAALQKAVDETKGTNRMLYFPNGTYLISDSIGIFDGKQHSKDRFLSWQGQSRDGTIIKLADNSPGFDNPDKPKVMVSVYSGASTGDVMHSYFKNMTVDIGSGNPGASGVRFFTNNIGNMEHVLIRSSDPQGAGAVGLDLSQSQNGPGLINHITVEGFDRGVLAKNSFSLVLEHITLKNNRKIGVDNEIARMTIRALAIDGAPQAIRNGVHADLIVIEADFRTASSDQPSIKLDGSRVFLRDIRQSGYAALVQDGKGELLKQSELKEWSPAPFYRLFGSSESATTLRLPIVETPVLPWEEDLSKWFTFEITKHEEDISDALQAAIDQAAKEGKTTLYFTRSFRKPKITKPIRVHGSINRIFGCMGEIDISDPTGAFKDGKAVFTLENLKSDLFQIERFFLLGGWNCPAHITMFENKSGKTIILRNNGIAGQVKKADPGGRWFLDDLSPSRRNTLLVGRNETIYARQFNPESPKNPMIHVDGGTFWILGLKTEGRATHAIVENSGKLEILGSVSYQSWGGQKLDPPIFIVKDSEVSASIGFYHHDVPFTTVVEETYGGQTKKLLREELKPYFLPVYRSAQ